MKKKQTTNSASVAQYLTEIGRYPLLTRDEEIALAMRVQDGDEEARDKMIRSNLRLVVKIAGDYSGCGLAIEDLICEGNIGLMKGVERFDPKYGVKLSTYAAWWIKQAIKKALGNQSRTIRIPLHALETMRKITRSSNQLVTELGREPTEREIADSNGVSEEKLAFLREAGQTVVSLDMPAPGEPDDSRPLESIIPDESVTDPFEALQAESVRDNVGAALAFLDDREQGIIVARFGLNGEPAKTLEEVGDDFGVTRERIRQIQKVAMQKLRAALSRIENPSVPRSVVRNQMRRKNPPRPRTRRAPSVASFAPQPEAEALLA